MFNSNAAIDYSSLLDTGYVDKGQQVRNILSSSLGRDAVKAAACRQSFFRFVTEFWGVVCNDPPVWNWHIPYICGELMRLEGFVGKRQPKPYDLIVNVPPGTTKSLIASVMFPAWSWTRQFWYRFIATSYGAGLSLDHGQKTRDIVKSEKYQRYFPDIGIRRTEDTKSMFRIEKRFFDKSGQLTDIKLGGGRLSSSVGGVVTGFHGHFILIDDPLDPQRAISDQEVKTANTFIEQTLSSRKTDKAVTPTILIQQRLRKNDPSGTRLKRAESDLLPVRHICLPGDLNAEGADVQPASLKKYYTDGLLDPVRLTRTVLKEMKATLGQYGFLSQVQQAPRVASAGMFQVNNIKIVPPIPRHRFRQVVRYWDKAATEDGGCFTAGCRMAELDDGKIAILHMEKGQWATHKREARIKTIAEMDGSETTVYF